MAGVGRRGTYCQYWLSDGATPPGPDVMLWEVGLDSTPKKDDLERYALKGGVLEDYSVVRVIREHEGPIPTEDSEGNPIGPGNPLCKVKIIVIVKEGF